MITREEPPLPADQSPSPPSAAQQQPTGKVPGLPPLHFPEQPAGEGPMPAPGGFPAPGGQQDDAPGPEPSSGAGLPRRAGPVREAPPRERPLRRPRPGAPGPPRPPEPAVRQRGLYAMLLGALSMVALLGLGSNFHRGIYLVVFALLAGIAACWFGITALRQAKRGATWRPRGAIFGTVFGALGSLISLALLIAFTLFWPQLTRYSQCLNSANTLSAQQACLQQLNRSVNGQIARLGTGG